MSVAAIDWAPLVAGIAARCAPSGLDLVQPLRVAWYNAACSDPALQLPDLGRAGALAVLIGGTRALWPHFRAAVAADPTLRDDPHPLDRWVTARVHAALAPLAPLRHEVRFAHEPPPRRIAIQRLADIAGLARLSRTHLSVHPIYGPWISLRAVAIIDVDGPPDPPTIGPDPCHRCAATDCEARLAEAVAASHDLTTDPVGAVSKNAALWIAVRDACVVGREHRYPDDMLRHGYHQAVVRSNIASTGA